MRRGDGLVEFTHLSSNLSYCLFFVTSNIKERVDKVVDDNNPLLDIV